MKTTKTLKNWCYLGFLGAMTLTSLQVLRSSVLAASTFSETPLDQSHMIAVARPYGDHKYDLLVIEQISGKQKCWAEKGKNPVTVDPLLLKFDFTGSCRRSTDSNGYSVRIDGEDYGLTKLLRIVVRDDELVLVATDRKDPTKEEIIIGRSKGLSAGLLKIQLEPSWRFTKRTFKGKQLGHFYFSQNTTGTTPVEEEVPVPEKKVPVPKPSPKASPKK